MDLTTIKATGRDARLTHPKTDEELGLVFHLRSPHSDEVKAVEREWQNKRLSPKQLRRGVNSEQIEALTTQRILAAVSGWTWEDPDVTLGGEQPDYSRAQLKAWLDDPDLIWIREFLTEETGDASSFFK